MDMGIHQIRLYDIFRKDLKLPDEKAAELIIALEDSEKSQIEKMNQPYIARMDAIEIIHRRLDTGMSELTREMGDLRKDMSSFKDDLRKSMYTIGIAQFIAIIGALLAIMKFMK